MRNTIGMMVMVGLAGLFALSAGCASGGGAAAATALPAGEPMTIVYLRTGPASATNTPEQKQQIFREHMANMQTLADARTLLIAGPLSKPRDASQRGIFIFDVPDVAKATALGQTDPGIVAGEFALEVRPISASASTRQTRRLERELQAELKAAGQPERKPGEPPPSLRAYVLMHAEDFGKARAALAAAKGPRVIWWAAFRDSPSGLIILDATKVDDAAAALAGLDVGCHGLDAWFSTSSLERLPDSARP